MQDAAPTPALGASTDFEIILSGKHWCLREAGAAFYLRTDASKAKIVAYAEDLLCNRSGRLTVKREDGTLEFERTFGPPPADLDGATSRLDGLAPVEDELRKQLAAQVEDVRVVIEERHIDLATAPEKWRSKEYRGLDNVPPVVPPAFPAPGVEGAEVQLLHLLQGVCAERKKQARFDLPYCFGQGRHKCTILRTVLVQLTLKTHVRNHG
jgi:hypothetical protein